MKKYSAIVLLAIFWPPAVLAQLPDDEVPVDTDVVVSADSQDQRIEARIEGVYALLEQLGDIEVEVREGVVLLSGSVSNQVQAERALALATQIPGVLTVDDGIERRLDVQGNLTPLLKEIMSDVSQWARALPLVALAVLIFAVIVFLGFQLANWTRFWQKLAPNFFVAELMAQAVRVVAVVVGLVVALSLLGATALMATILGGAGVVGLAIGFAVRDTMENYISSIMLSLRQPFRANDHVVINEFEGKVVRLTSRATVLMTLDGNQLRIPNAMVFKAVILNYTRNPQRRFQFELGIDSADDAIAAMKVGADTIQAMSFVLKDPAANAIISSVGDSNTMLMFTGWIDQRETDFGRARSLAIRAVTSTLDAQGFSMPEPIYRLRFDSHQDLKSSLEEALAAPAKEGSRSSTVVPVAIGSIDVAPDTDLDGMVNEERALDNENDLLDDKRPAE